MRTYIERKLREIRKTSIEKSVALSCDIYYNELGEKKGEQYVVKLYNIRRGINLHFRSNSVRKSLKMALKHLRSIV